MYEFYYRYIKRKFIADLLFTDTDSLVYETGAEDIYEDFYKDRGWLVLVTIHEIQSSLILLIKKLLAK